MSNINEFCVKCGHNRFLHADYDYTGETDICCGCSLFVPIQEVPHLVKNLESVLQIAQENDDTISVSILENLSAHMEKLNKIDRFINRLRKINIHVELSCNYPWVYIDKINGKYVTEKFKSKHQFAAFFMPYKPDDSIKVTDTKEIFTVIRKYL